jgi:hypothetical protein
MGRDSRSSRLIKVIQPNDFFVPSKLLLFISLFYKIHACQTLTNHLKCSMTKEGKYEQLKQDADEWLFKLGLLKEENISLKHCLSIIVAEKADPLLLKKVEALQNRLLNKDIIIQFLRKEIIEHKILLEEIKEDVIFSSDIVNRHAKLRNDIDKLSKRLNALRADFANYL